MVTLQDVLVDALWVIGLAGLLATVSDLAWRRHLYRWGWRQIFATPRARFATSFSLLCVCSGAAGRGLLNGPPDGQWSVLVWGILSFLYIIQTVVYAWAGEKYGWDSSTEGTYRP
jgi:hypothetical protein